MDDDHLWQDTRRSTLIVQQPLPDGDDESRFLKSTLTAFASRGSTPRLLPWELFFCGTPTEKASREGQRFRNTKVAESPIPSHTDVVADYAQRTNCILFNVGIGFVVVGDWRSR